MGRVVWVSRCHAPRVSFGAWGGLARVVACLRYACERFACARFSFVLFGCAPLAARVYDGGVPRGGGLPVGLECGGLVVSIIPVLVTMQVLKQQGRWPGAGGVYGGYPVSRVDARRRYESVCARHEDESYRRVGKGGCSDEEVRHLAVLVGVTALFLGVGTFALCACSRHWEIIFMPCVLVAAGVAVLYAAWRMGRS